jgi:hypothetical protein
VKLPGNILYLSRREKAGCLGNTNLGRIVYQTEQNLAIFYFYFYRVLLKNKSPSERFPSKAGLEGGEIGYFPPLF